MFWRNQPVKYDCTEKNFTHNPMISAERITASCAQNTTIMMMVMILICTPNYGHLVDVSGLVSRVYWRYRGNCEKSTWWPSIAYRVHRRWILRFRHIGAKNLKIGLL